MKRHHETDTYVRSLDFIENKEMWNTEFFRTKNKRVLENYKYDWASFCKLSYNDQQNPPTEDMYIDFIEKKRESGRTEKAIYCIFLRLRKTAFHVYGQKLLKFERLKRIIPNHSEVVGKPKCDANGVRIPKPGNRIDDSGICPHCGEVSTILI